MNQPIVAYFSLTGVTEGVARRLSEAIHGELFEIRGEKTEGQPESSLHFTCDCDDLTNRNPIYVGLPVWWYAAPAAINAFLESYDLKGKTVVPFITSGAGSLDQIRPSLLDSCPGAEVKKACFLSDNLTREELAQWAHQAAGNLTE